MKKIVVLCITVIGFLLGATVSNAEIDSHSFYDSISINAWFMSYYEEDMHKVEICLNGSTMDCVVKIDVNNISSGEITTLYFEVEEGTTDMTVDVPLTDYDETVQLYGSIMDVNKEKYYVVPSQFAFFTPYPDTEMISDTDFMYCVINEEAEIIGYIGSEEETKLIIPDILGGYPVTSIRGWSLSGTEFEEISIGKNIKRIGYGALSYNYKLKNIVVDSQNPYFKFENGILYNNDKTELLLYLLTNTQEHYTIPNGVRMIGAHAFEAHENLKSVTIPQGVKRIERQAFAFSSIGGELILPEGLEFIGFEGLAAKFTKIYIPSTVSFIASDAFLYSSDLAEFNVNEENAYFASRDGVLFSKDLKTLLTYPAARKINTYILPDELEEIGCGAMAAVDVNAVYVPKTVTTILENGLANDFATIIYESTQEDFEKIAGIDGTNWSADILYNGTKTGAMLNNASCRYIDNSLVVKADIPYLFETGTVIVAVFDENERFVCAKTVDVTAETHHIKCIFDADKKILDYTVKFMYWNNLQSFCSYNR